MPVSRHAPAIERVHPNAEWPTRYLVSGDCWIFQGQVHSKNGYGVAKHLGVRHYVHRLAYRLWVGEIPATMTIDHTCANQLCINPAHLEAVTHSENSRRMQLRRAADPERMCNKGLHLLAESRYSTAEGKGRCRPCANEYQNARRRRMAA